MFGCVALALGSCFVEADVPKADEGTAIVDWTIDGYQDASECRQGSAQSVSVAVYGAGGGYIGDYQQRCDAFELRIYLPEGDYIADATLLDERGDPRTTAVAIEPFSIYGPRDVVTLPVDFPTGSFY